MYNFKAMPSKFESFDARRNEWITEEILKPGQFAGVIQYLPSEKIIHYTFECSVDDSKSVIKSKTEDSQETKIEAELQKNSKPYIIAINGQKGAIRVIRKFSHI